MTLEELNIKFTAQTSGLQSQLSAINTQLGGLETSAGRTQGAFSNMGKMMAVGATALIVRGLFQVGSAAISMANDAVESDNLFEVSMGNMAGSARQWSEDLSKSLGLNAYEVRKNVGTLNTMFDSMGIGEQSAYDMSKGLTELANDMASFYNLSTEEAFQKLQSGITGEAEPLKRLGILVNENTVKQYAYANGIAKAGSVLSDQQKVMARYGTIMEQTEKAQGDLARTMDSPVNQIRRMNAELDQAKIALGQSLQPALLAVLPVLTGMASTATRVINALNGSNSNVTSAFEDVATSMDEAREIAATSISTETEALVAEIEAKRKEVEDAITEYAQAAQATKSVVLALDLKPMTTGRERINAKLDELEQVIQKYANDFSVPIFTYLDVLYANGDINETELNKRKAEALAQVQSIIDAGTALTAKVRAMIEIALSDGVVTFSEQTEIQEAIDSGLSEIEETAKANLKVQVDRIRLDIQKGRYTVEEGEAIIDQLIAATEAELSNQSAVSVDLKAEMTVKDWDNNEIVSKLEELRFSLQGKMRDFDVIITAYLTTLLENKQIDEVEFSARRNKLNSDISDINAKYGALNIKISTLLNAAISDGVVTFDESENITEKLNSGANALIEDALSVLNVQIENIRLDVKNGKISTEDGEKLIKQATDEMQSTIDAINDIRISVEAALAIVDWNSKSISAEDKKAIALAIEKELAAGEAIKVDASVYVSSLWSGTGDIGNAVTEAFSGANAAATTAGEKLKEYVNNAITNGTEIDFDTLNQLREAYYDAMSYITGGLTPGGAFNKALFDLTMSPESIQNLAGAYAESQTATAQKQEDLRTERLNFLYNIQNEPGFDKYLADNGFASMQEAINAVNQIATDAIQQNASDMVTRAAENIVPRVNASETSWEDALDLSDSLTALIDTVDASGLSEDAKKSYDTLVQLRDDLIARATKIMENFQNDILTQQDAATGGYQYEQTGSQQFQKPSYLSAPDTLQQIVSGMSSALSDATIKASNITIEAPTNGYVDPRSIERFAYATGGSETYQITLQATPVKLYMDNVQVGKATISAQQTLTKASGGGARGQVVR